jgi:hypothetical protein
MVNNSIDSTGLICCNNRVLFNRQGKGAKKKVLLRSWCFSPAAQLV